MIGRTIKPMTLAQVRAPMNPVDFAPLIFARSLASRAPDAIPSSIAPSTSVSTTEFPPLAKEATCKKKISYDSDTNPLNPARIIAMG